MDMMINELGMIFIDRIRNYIYIIYIIYTL